jgi:hypothetical protein
MLRLLDPRCEVVQFRSALSDGDYRVLADWLVSYPSVSLRAYGSDDGSIRDLEFLRFSPRCAGSPPTLSTIRLSRSPGSGTFPPMRMIRLG